MSPFAIGFACWWLGFGAGIAFTFVLVSKRINRTMDLAYHWHDQWLIADTALADAQAKLDDLHHDGRP